MNVDGGKWRMMNEEWHVMLWMMNVVVDAPWWLEECKYWVIMKLWYSHVNFCVSMASIQMIAMTQRRYTEAFTQRSLYTEELLHTDAFTNRSFYTEESLDTEVFRQGSFFTHRRVCTQKFLRRGAYTHTHTSFYKEKSLYRGAFTQRRFYTDKLLHK